MSLATRLSRLTPALFGKERALLVTRAHLDRREPDASLFVMPADQRVEYDYFIALVYTSNTTLGVMVRSLAWIADSLERDQAQYARLAEAAGFVEVALEETPDPEVVRKWKGHSSVTLPDFLRRLERELRGEGLQRLLLIWQELGALELMWAEISQECDGEDLRCPELIVEFTEARERLQKLLMTVSPRHARKPPEPSAEILADFRKAVDEAMRFMSLREAD